MNLESQVTDSFQTCLTGSALESLCRTSGRYFFDSHALMCAVVPSILAGALPWPCAAL